MNGAMLLANGAGANSIKAPSRVTDSPTPPAEAIRAALGNLLASRVFSRSDRLRRFLRYAVEGALGGGTGELKETLIAIHVFDRGSDFDPGTDPIVRVEARRLRVKLGQYYQTEGREAEVEIELPTGAYVPRFRWRRPIPAVASPNEPPTGEERSLVVLPLINLSSNPDDEYFSDGLTEQIIHELTKLEDLRLVAWQSAFRLKGQSEDVRAVGEQLGVTTLLQGSVQRWGERVRVAVHLIGTADGRYLWSETYDRALRDVLTLQDEVAAAIAAAVRLRLSGQPMPARRRLHDEVPAHRPATQKFAHGAT
jgi:adenylate cyclase